MTAEDKSFYRTSRVDILLIVFILLISFSSLAGFWSPWAFSSQQPVKAVIYSGKELLKEVDLSRNGFFSILDGRMQFEVKDHGLRVVQADCPQHICIHRGWIRRAGQAIACVPNHVLVEIKFPAAQVVDVVAR